MAKKYVFFFLALGLLGMSCKDSNLKSNKQDSSINRLAPETNHPAFVSDMEVAHQKSKLLNQGIVCFNLDLTFGGKNSKMKIFTTPNSSAIRVDKKDGPTTVMINGDIYTDADSSRWPSEKSGLFTYQYFFMAPFKFSDSGTIWTKLTDMEIDGKLTNRSKLTFESGTGDAPDDWYIIHSDPNSHRVEYIGYIVTGGGTPIEEAEKNAHAIKYSNYQDVNGIPIATKWEFFEYSQDEDLGDKIGEAILKNIELMDVVDQFEIIEDGTYQKIRN